MKKEKAEKPSKKKKTDPEMSAAERVLALSPLDKAKLRKKKCERLRAEISTTTMGLKLCEEQQVLVQEKL